MRTIAQRLDATKRQWSARGAGLRGSTVWIEWQELKFILLSVGIPVLLVACIVQVLPHLLRLL